MQGHRPRRKTGPASSENTMAQTIPSKEPATAQYTVLRPICMAGERVEVGATVELTPGQYAELKAAGKVGPLAAKPAPADKGAKPETKEVKK